jgi:transposase
MRRRKATVELFEEIRREYEFGIGTIQGVARKLGVHRRLVREALNGAVPVVKVPQPRPRPRIEPVAAFIDAILEADRQAPRKQRHTAHRIYVRLGQERPEHAIAESTVRRYVQQRRVALGLARRETFVPQSYPWGSEAQVDWYEAVAELGDERVTLQVFSMRSMASGAAFHRAYRHATQQAFLEAHELAFPYFGGVFRRLRYDNLTAAVKRVLRGSRREETTRFVAFRSHWRFESEFCTPAEGHEKGGVESEVGRFRRNQWVPVPRADDLEALNRQLLAACQADEARTVAGRAQSVGAGMLIERAHLLPLAGEGFDLAEVSFPVVTSLSCVKVKTNAYSVPVTAGRTVEVKLAAAHVEIWHEGKPVARHERCYGRYQEVLDLEHYLDVLERKPGALAGSKPLEQWRKLGRWPESYDRFWQALIARHGRQAGAKAMIELLQVGRVHGQARLLAAIDAALVLGCTDAAAVRHLVTAQHLEHARPEAMAVGALAQFERPLPTVGEYDRLLGQRQLEVPTVASVGAAVGVAR